MSSRASADVGEPACAIFLEAAAKQAPNQLAAMPAGSAVQSGSRSRIAASVSDSVVARERGAARQHLVQHAAERPDVGPLVDGAGPAPAPGSCRRPCRG